MQKIMFNNRYGLTDAVIKGIKKMTRRILPDIEDGVKIRLNYDNTVGFNHGDGWYLAPKKYQPKYYVGEIISVAQAYKDLRWPSGLPGVDMGTTLDEIKNSHGWNNKMFVRAEYMPCRIKITGIKLEHLQDISDEDCLKEGIVRRDDVLDLKLNDVVRYTFEGSFVNHVYKMYKTAKEAFAALIDRVSGSGTWKKNPYVVVYTFELME